LGCEKTPLLLEYFTFDEPDQGAAVAGNLILGL
jgi:hypothetical protein